MQKSIEKITSKKIKDRNFFIQIIKNKEKRKRKQPGGGRRRLLPTTGLLRRLRSSRSPARCAGHPGAELPSAAAAPLALGLQLPSAVAVPLALGVELPSAAARSPAAAPLAWGDGGPPPPPPRAPGAELPSRSIERKKGSRKKRKPLVSIPLDLSRGKGGERKGERGEGEAAGMVCSARGKGKEMRRGRRNTERGRQGWRAQSTVNC